MLREGAAGCFELVDFLLLLVYGFVERFDQVFLVGEFALNVDQAFFVHTASGLVVLGAHFNAALRNVSGNIRIMRSFPAANRSLAAYLKRGGVIAYPTESCYGLGCDPANRRAVQRILQLKQRPQHKGLILIAAHYRQVVRYIQPLTQAEQRRLRDDGAQAITYLMPVKPSCPRWLRGAHDTLAIRMTAHPTARNLCRNAGSALVSTSANRSGMRAARTYAECKRIFGNAVWVLRGQVGKRKRPSTIRAWGDGRILRN